MRAGRGIRRAVAGACAAVVVSLALAGCSAHAGQPTPLATTTATLPAATRTQLRAAVTDAMTAAGASGAIVGVWVPWSGTWVTGLGTTTRGGKQPVTAGMTFRAGDITRAMTCDVLYAVAAKGVVHVDDPVTDYVGGVASLGDVTLQELCDGTGGLGPYDAALDAMQQADLTRDWDPRQVLSYGLGGVDDDLKPGTTFRDSPAGYVLLGLALERATGETATQLVRQYVARPLRLAHTALPGTAPADPVVDGSEPLPGFFYDRKASAGGYVCTDPSDATEQSDSFDSTAAGVVSDIDDLGSYVRALATDSLVPSKDRFARPRPLSTAAPSWMQSTGGAVQAGRLVGQYGSVPGYLTAAFSDPDSGLTVAVVLNNSTAGAGVILDLARELAAVASKAPATGSAKTVAVGLPWTAQQYHDAIAQTTVCAPGR